MILYLKLTQPITGAIYCVESKFAVYELNKVKQILNKEKETIHSPRTLPGLMGLMHVDTITIMRDDGRIYSGDTFIIEYVPNSCVKKLFGGCSWEHYKVWPK
jgi:hypothetical protein